MNTLMIYFLFIIYKFDFILTLTDIKNCRNALGMQSGHILDSQITASSSFDEITLGPGSSRIRTEKNGGAWCPKSQITTSVYEYLQINLKTLHVLTMIETQGRFGNGQGVELTESYRIEYTRDKFNLNDTRWIRYKDRDDNKEFKGNENTYSAELRELNKPIIARQIRIIPISKLKRTVCLRVELYGCQFKDDILSYETRNGDVRDLRDGTTANFKDKIYDGIETKNGYLKNGLGLLTDGELGDDLYRFERYNTKGYDWLGWHNDSFSPKQHHRKQQQQVNKENSADDGTHKILFKFDNIRNFSLCTIYINNAPNQRIELYKLIRFKFSLNGVDFNSELESSLNRDLNMNMARPILVPLKFNVAKYVLIEIYFYNRWLLISEITFDSEYVDFNAFNLFDNQNQPAPSQSQLQESDLLTASSVSTTIFDIFNATNLIKSTDPMNSRISATEGTMATTNSYFITNHLTLQSLIMLLISLLLLLIIIFIFIIYCFLKKKRRLKKKFQQHQLHTHHHHHHKKRKYCFNFSKLRGYFFLKRDSTTNTNTLSTALTSTSSSASSTNNNGTNIIPITSPNHPLNLITSLPAQANLNSLTTALLAAQQQQHQQLNNLDTIKSTKFLNSFENSLESTYLYPSLKYKAITPVSANALTTENADLIKAFTNQQQQRYLKLIENNNTNNIHYAATDLSSNTTASTTSTNSIVNKMIKLIPIQYGTSNINNNNNSNGNNNTNLYYTIKPTTQAALSTLSRLTNSNQHLLQIQQQVQQQQIEFISMRKIDANLLCFLDKIGESTVSNFYVGKMNTKSLNSNLLLNENNEDEDNDDSSTDVLIKVLKNEHDPAIKFGFDSDIDLTIINKLKIDNLNLIKLIGFCDNPYCYIIDYYSNNSNLYEYILNNNNNNFDINNNSKLLINICLQITNAMLYLETISQIHKDLTCKNCIININSNNEISIKICDLARYLYSYRNDYCILLTHTQQSIRLRYTSWETICTGQFTSKSDIWSFGIIIFELLNLCKQIPYGELNDEQLIQLVNSTYIQQQQQQQQQLNYLIHNYLLKQSLIDEFRLNNNDLVDLMFECLNLNIFNRPTFNDLNLVLKYKHDSNT